MPRTLATFSAMRSIQFHRGTEALFVPRFGAHSPIVISLGEACLQG
jgi:hypothetical protein